MENESIIQLLIEKAEEWAIQERLQFNKIYHIILDYMHQHKIIIGGITAANIISNISSKDNFEFVIYGVDILFHCNTMANLICDKVGTQIMISLRTDIAFFKYSLTINNRILFRAYELKKVHNVDPHKMIMPIKMSFLAKPILILSPEVQLIPIYRILYSPHMAAHWETNFAIENRLFGYLTSRKSIIGGSMVKQNERHHINKKMIDFLITKKNKVFIGEYACSLVFDDYVPETYIIEVISADSIESDIDEITTFITKEFELPVEALTRDLFIMDDFQIKRTTIKVGAENNSKDLLYIYNSANYDLIPYNNVMRKTQVVKVGSPFVIMRFLLINIWIIRWIFQLGGINEKFFDYRINGLLALIIKIRKRLLPEGHLLGSSSLISEKYLDTEDALSVFQSERYIGSFINESITQKIFATKSKFKFGEYHPAIYKKTYGTYRILQSRQHM